MRNNVSVVDETGLALVPLDSLGYDVVQQAPHPHSACDARVYSIAQGVHFTDLLTPNASATPCMVALAYDRLLVIPRRSTTANVLSMPLASHRPGRVSRIFIAADGEPLVFFSATDGGGVLLAIPLQRERRELAYRTAALSQFHNEAELPTLTLSSDELRAVAAASFGRPAGASSVPVASTALATCSTPSALSARWMDVVANRVQFLRESFEAAERSCNAVFQETSNDYAQAHSAVDAVKAVIATENAVLDSWARDQGDKQKQLVALAANVRRAKDAARDLVIEKEQAHQSFTQEVQSWRKILSERQATELKVKQALVESEARREASLEDARRALDELCAQRAEVDAAIARFEDPDYVRLLARRDSLVQLLANETEELRRLVEQEETKSAAADRRDEEEDTPELVLGKHSALRATIAAAQQQMEQHAAAHLDLERDQKAFAEDTVALRDEIALVELDEAQRRAQLAAIRRDCNQTAEQLVRVRAGAAVKERQLADDPLMRFRVARVRAQRAQLERESIAASAARATSVQRSVSQSLQQQVLFESLRLQPSLGTLETQSQAENGLDHEDDDSDLLAKFNQLLTTAS